MSERTIDWDRVNQLLTAAALIAGGTATPSGGNTDYDTPEEAA